MGTRVPECLARMANGKTKPFVSFEIVYGDSVGIQAEVLGLRCQFDSMRWRNVLATLPWPLFPLPSYFFFFFFVAIYNDGNGFLVIGDDLFVGDAG